MKRFGVFLILVAVVSHLAWKHWDGRDVARDFGATEIQALAAGVKAEEVVMYSTTECPYCAQAKAWLNQNGFDSDEFLAALAAG